MNNIILRSKGLHYVRKGTANYKQYRKSEMEFVAFATLLMGHNVLFGKQVHHLALLFNICLLWRVVFVVRGENWQKAGGGSIWGFGSLSALMMFGDVWLKL